MEPQQRNWAKSKLVLITCIALIIIGGASAAVAHYTDLIYREVTLNDDGYIVRIQTMDKTVEELLDKYEITLGPGDQVLPGLGEELQDETSIEIQRAFKVTVAADGNETTIYLIEGTVGDALKKAKVTLDKKDLVNYDISQSVMPGDHIRVTRVKEETMVEEEGIPYRVITKNDDKLDKGKEKVTQEGKEGIQERKILVAYYDGVEVNREIVEERVSKEPVDMIISKGTYVAPPVSRGNVSRDKKSTDKKTSTSKSSKDTGKSKESSKDTSKKSSSSKDTSKKSSSSKSTSNKSTGTKVLLASGTYTFQATSYTHTGNKTRTGVWPKEGMIAVDPKLIPLRSSVYVEFPKPWSHLNGNYKAMDTGGAIKGKIIDIFIDDKGTVKKFGRVHGVKVTIP